MTQSASESETHNLVMSKQSAGLGTEYATWYFRLSCDCGWQYITDDEPSIDLITRMWYTPEHYRIRCPYDAT